jgi:hypothetical protein
VLKLRENVQKLSEVLFRFKSERAFAVARRIKQRGCDLADFVDLWKRTGVSSELERIWKMAGVLGGWRDRLREEKQGRCVTYETAAIWLHVDLANTSQYFQ